MSSRTQKSRAVSQPKPAARPLTQSRSRAGRRSVPAKTRIELGGLTNHLGYLIRRAQLWVFQDFIRTLAVLDIKPAQYSVLTVIDANRGLSQMSLARALGIERARMTHMIDALEARGLVRREASRFDRRSHALHLTAEGRRMLGRIRELAALHEKRLAAKVGHANHKKLLRMFGVFAHR